MKILFISLNDHVPWGGSEELWKQAAITLNTRHEVKAFVKKWEEEPSQIIDLKRAGIQVLYKNVHELGKENQRMLGRLRNKLSGRHNQANQQHDLQIIEDIQSYNLAIISVGNHVDGNLPTYANYLLDQNVRFAIIVQLATDLRIVPDDLSRRLLHAYKNAFAVFFWQKKIFGKRKCCWERL